MYALLRAIAGVALRWYYRDIQVEGFERIPRHRPLLLVVNHPNALVDALLVGWVMPRRVLITAKSTLFANPLANVLLRVLGVLPLRRTSDEARAGQQPDPARNRDTFRAVHEALRDGGVVLIFPEGKSHDEPSLAPLKTGAARIALQARAEAAGSRLRDLAILPIGLTFERKDAPRSRVLVQIGEPILVDSWQQSSDAPPADALTVEIDARLRAVTTNYASTDDAARAVRLASLVVALFDAVPDARMQARGLGTEAIIARRIDDLTRRVRNADDALRARADRLVRRLDAVQQVAANHGLLVEDLGISLAVRDGARFIAREGWTLLVGGPFALWGRVNHWLPFRAARLVAARSVESAADPAMRTLIAGVAFVSMSYLVQTLIVALVFGRLVALCYVASLPIAADINFWLSERLRRTLRRARAYVVLRRDPALRRRLEAELATLREDVIDFERALTSVPSSVSAYGTIGGGR